MSTKDIPNEERQRRIKAMQAFERECGDGNHETFRVDFSEGDAPREEFDLEALVMCENCPATIEEVHVDEC